jgi:predicted DNA-binding transcriptional regulator AlpA
LASSYLEVSEEVSEQIAPLQTPGQVGKTLGRHPKTVLLLYRRGELPGFKLGARTVRFAPADVQRYIDQHRTVVAS